MTSRAHNHHGQRVHHDHSRRYERSRKVITDRVWDIFKSRDFSPQNKQQLSEDFAELTGNELKSLLEDLFEDVSEQAETEDPLKIVQQLADLIPEDTLAKAAGYRSPKSALKDAMGMLQEAKYHLEKVKGPASPTLLARLRAILDMLITVLENILFALGIAEFFTPTENELHASIKAQKIMVIISIFTLLTATLLPMFGVTTGASIVGSLLVAVAVLSVAFPYIRPVPSTLPGDPENWTKMVHQGDMPTIGERPIISTQIGRTIEAGSHPLLVGKSGIGKTHAAQAFARAVELTDKFPKLKGKKILYYNAADLVSDREMFGGGNKILKKIKDAMGRHKGEFILVIDEIHILCQDREETVIGEQIKTYLDKHFPHVIGITTEEEYYQYIHKDKSAFARRFKRISIDSTDPENTQETLNHTLLKQAPETLVDRKAFDHLVDITDQLPQPLSVLNILATCLEKTSDKQKSSTEDELEKKQNRVRALSSKGAVGHGSALLGSDDKRYDDIDQLEREIKKLEKNLALETEQRDDLFKARKQLSRVTTETFKTVLKVCAVQETTHLNQFLLLKYFAGPQLESRVRTQAKDLGIRVGIDRALIDGIIEEDTKSKEEADLAVAKGRQQLEERNAKVESSFTTPQKKRKKKEK